MLKRSLFAFALVGCGVEPAPSPPSAPHDIREQSGSRLKIEWWETSDGALGYRGIFDTQLGEECSPQQIDGNAYCATATARSLDQYAVLTHDVQSAVARVVPASYCSADGLVVPAGFFDTDRGLECAPIGLAGDAGYACTPIGAVADATVDAPLALVADSDDGHRLERMYFAAIDGLRQHISTFWDAELSVSCTMEPRGALAFCMPSDVEAIPTIDP